MSEPLTTPPAITFDDDPPSPDSESATPQPSAPDPAVLTAKLEAAEAERSRLEDQLKHDRAEKDRLWQENRAADDLLRQAYRPQDEARALVENVKFEEPTPPTQEEIIQNPHLAVEYARQHSQRYADYAVKRAVAQMTPILAATTQMAPIAADLAEFRRHEAMKAARESLDETERPAFDEALPKIQKTISQAQWGAKHSMHPQSYLLAYQALGGHVRPVKSRTAPPPTADTNTRPAGQSAAGDNGRVPEHIKRWAKQANQDPKRLWERMKKRNVQARS